MGGEWGTIGGVEREGEGCAVKHLYRLPTSTHSYVRRAALSREGAQQGVACTPWTPPQWSLQGSLTGRCSCSCSRLAPSGQQSRHPPTTPRMVCVARILTLHHQHRFVDNRCPKSSSTGANGGAEHPIALIALRCQIVLSQQNFETQSAKAVLGGRWAPVQNAKYLLHSSSHGAIRMTAGRPTTRFLVTKGKSS